MKKLILSLFILAMCSQAFSQKIYFAYLQSETGQPFFVRMNDKIYSSSASGYLILSRLLDSTYTIHLGFPGQTSAEQKFSIPINHKDRGYLLKNFGEKGWGLFDLQSLQVQMSSNANAQSTSIADPNVSPFTEILSKAADDPSLKEKAIVATVEKKETAVIPAVQKEEVAAPIVNNDVVSTTAKEPVTEKVIPGNIKTASEQVQQKKEEEIKQDVAVSEQKTVQPSQETRTKDYKPSKVTRQAESTGTDGHDMVFVDKQDDGKTDTIRLVIPNNKPVVAPVTQERKEEKKFLDITAEPAKEKAEENISARDEPKKEPVKPVSAESNTNDNKPASSVKKAAPVNNCKNTADDNDFLKLRRKMVAADNEDDMVTEARKYFRTTCFTAYQIRNLGNLFLSDEGKYKLFDAAYPFVSDSHNFVSLKLELKEGYWVKRFEAMLK